MLNEYVDDQGFLLLESYEELPMALELLPRPSSEREYHLLVVNAECEPPPPTGTRCALLGHDLSDRTLTSSVLNCGPWTGELAPFTLRLNHYGLFTLEDAIAAKSVLPRAWPDHPHALVTVWALYDVEPDR